MHSINILFGVKSVEKHILFGVKSVEKHIFSSVYYIWEKKMFERKIMKELVLWKNKSTKKSLILEGARQVGKTFIVREFAKKYYKTNFIEINFIINPSYKDIFVGDISFEAVLQKIKILFPSQKFTDKGLLFLDEIQECPQAITALKSFSNISEFDVIASGSLLGVHYHRVSSFPVGYVERMTLYPLDLEEFANALNQGELFKIIKNNYLNKEKSEKVFHDKMLDLFIQYIVIGGMPEVVKTFVETSDYARVFENQRNIINDYKDDIAKYANSTEKVRAREIFDSIPFQLSKTNKKFQYSHIKKGGRRSDYEGSIKWLIDAGIVYKANLLTNLEIPLITYSNPDHFKIYFIDTGLLVSMLGKDAQQLLISNELGIAKGAIYENIIACILKMNNHNLYYYERTSGLEIDFITTINKSVVAIEVKSGENTKSKSLQILLDEKLVSYGIKLSRKNFYEDEFIKSYPLYLSTFI